MKPTIEERMLEAIKKDYRFSLTECAKSCASIAQEEIDKAVKERDNKLKKIGEIIEKYDWETGDPGEAINRIQNIL